MHRLKGPPNILQIALHRCKDDGRHTQLQARCDIPLDRILQFPQQKHVSIALNANKSFMASLQAMIWTARPAPEPQKEDEDILDEPSSTSAMTDASDSLEPPSELIDDQKNPANALLRLRPALFSKIKLVRQSGSKIIDRLKHNLRRRSFSASDEEIGGNEKVDYPLESEQMPTVSQVDDSELIAMTFADLHTQIETIASSFTNDPGLLPNTIIFVDRNARQARQLLEWSHRTGCKSVVSTQRMAFFGDCQEAEALFSGLMVLYQQSWQSSSSLGDHLRIAVAGDDASVSMIVRPFVQLMAREPRGWLGLKFYIIPINSKGSDITIAERIAQSDPQYRALFRSSAWESALDGSSTLIEPVGRQVEDSIARYMLKADGLLRLPIAEAMLEIEDADDPDMNGIGVSIPVIRDFSVVDVDYGPFIQHHQARFPAIRAPKPLVVEYWAPDKKAGKVCKFTLKTGISSMRVFRQDSVIIHDNGHEEEKASGEAADLATDSVMADESLHMVVHLSPKDKNKFLQKLGAYSPKKAESTAERNEIITKFVCSAPPDTKFTACVDGMIIAHCKFASLTPLWPTRTKHFPVAVFKNFIG